MEQAWDLSRFHTAQEHVYQTALSEIRAGRKETHWMWFIFPQLKGLGRSATAMYYGIDGLEEARAYWADDVLRSRLLGICTALLFLETDSARRVMGYPDDMKLQSCMTLFHAVAPENPEIRQVLWKYFGGQRDMRTWAMLGLPPDDRIAARSQPDYEDPDFC